MTSNAMSPSPPGSARPNKKKSAVVKSESAEILAQDCNALNTMKQAELHRRGHDQAHSAQHDDHDESDDTDEDSDASDSWWLDPSIPASNTLSACLDLINASEKSAVSVLSSIPCLLNAAYHLFVLLPASIFFAVLSHLFLPRRLWQRGGAPRRLSWPVRRSHNWTVRDTVTVAVVSHLLPAFTSVSKTRFCPSAERLIPFFSRNLFGVKHQGWTIEGVAIQLRQDEHLKQEFARHGYNAPQGTAPTPVLLWKSHARNVHHHQIVSFKPSISCGGIGGGQARSRHERVLLLLSGSSYVDRDPISGLLACNLVNLTGLRCLCVNWRRPSSNSQPRHGAAAKAFPAGLNDALQAYLHLIKVMKFRPENVYIVAEGSGAGIAMGLMTWLSAWQTQREEEIKAYASSSTPLIGKPGKMIMWSPWCDLTMQSPTWKENGPFDIVSQKQAQKARDTYISSLGVTPRGDSREEPRGQSTQTELFSSTCMSHSKQQTHRGDLRRKESSHGSDSGLEIDSRPGSPFSPPLLATSTLTAPISTLMKLTGSDSSLSADRCQAEGDEPRMTDPPTYKSQSDLQQHYSKALTTSPASSMQLLMSSLLDLGLEHPLLSPGLPLMGSFARTFNEDILRLLHKPSPLRSTRTRPGSAPVVPSYSTQYLIFCGRDSVIWGEAASLANNLATVEDKKDDGAQSRVTFLSALDTPTLFNLLPSVFLPQAQTKADDIVRHWLVGDVPE